MGLCWLALTALLRPPAVTGFYVKVPAALVRVGTFSSVSFQLQQTSNDSNPLLSMMGDMASSVLGSKKDVAAIDGSGLKNLIQNNIPNLQSWDDIRQKLEELQTTEEKQFRSNLKKGYGIGSPMHKIRLYDSSNKEEDIRVTFYRDSASWCPYCQKVWIALEEKKIPYRIEKVNMRCYGDKPASFMRLQPSGNIPVAVIDGRVLGQSNDILYQLDEAFPDTKSLKGPENLRMEAQELLRLERQLFSSWMYWLTSGGDSERFTTMFTADLKEVEAALKSADGPFFLGKDISIVDIQFSSFLERMAASLLYYKGFQMRVVSEKDNFPNVNAWFDAMEELASYQLTKSDYYTHCWDLPPQLGGCVMEANGKPYAAAINGEMSLDGSQNSWDLPLQLHNGGIEPDWTGSSDDDVSAARREAVERLSFNQENIVKFAARGAGRKGMPPVMAPLADPNATPSESVQDTVSVILRTICAVLLDGTSPTVSESSEGSVAMVKIAQATAQQGGLDFTNAVINSLAYLRDRVGVPRDMRLPAARQLRAHLNWSIRQLESAKKK